MVNLKRYTSKKTKEIISENHGVLFEEASKKYLIPIYLLDDNSIIIDYDTHGIKYESLAAFESFVRQLESKNRVSVGEHLLKGKFDYKPFLANVASYVDTINKIFSFKENPSLDKLKAIDSLYGKLQLSNSKGKLFTPLIAYVGEVIKAELKGDCKWDLRVSSEDESIVEPYVYCGGKLYDPFTLVYKEIFEEFYESGDIALFDHTKIELAK